MKNHEKGKSAFFPPLHRSSSYLGSLSTVKYVCPLKFLCHDLILMMVSLALKSSWVCLLVEFHKSELT